VVDVSLKNYHRDVAPILQKHCQTCHRPGEIGQFALTTYPQARRWASDIKDYTQNCTFRQLAAGLPPLGGNLKVGGSPVKVKGDLPGRPATLTRRASNGTATETAAALGATP